MKSFPSRSFIFQLLLIILLFATAEITTHLYGKEIATTIKDYGALGQAIFVFMAALAVIIPIWSNIFLIPFGVVAWGALPSALLCILGWQIGSMVSFFIARRYKEWLAIKYPLLTSHEFVDSLISTKHKVLSLIFLRMTLPVDILSYALGLFSKKVSWKENAITTLVGITPFAFIFSYITIFPPHIQGGIVLLTALLFIVYIIFREK